MQFNKALLICRRKMQAMNTCIFPQLFPLHKKDSSLQIRGDFQNFVFACKSFYVLITASL